MTWLADTVADRTVLVVGAGPAGLAAAVTAADGGLSVVLIDSSARIGGQYWRHGPGGPNRQLHHDLDTFTSLSSRLEVHVAARRVKVLLWHQVWAVEVGPGSCSVHVLDRTDPQLPAETTLSAAYLVLATGAYDRQVPFPGWTLPGVMTVGAAQALLKGSGVAVGRRVLVAGTGPFLLPVAAGLAAHGTTVVGVHEANHPLGWLRHLRALPAATGKLGEALGYLTTLVSHRVRMHHRSIVVAARGNDRLESVTVAGLGRDGAIRPGSYRRVPVDVLAVGYGFTAQSELALQAGCEVQVTPDQTIAVTVDDRQGTSNPRVFAAGEITGIGGAQLAVAEGSLAGAAVVSAAVSPRAAELISQRRERDALHRFASAMHAVYPTPTAWLDLVRPDTVVCRCEEVTVADLDRAVGLGARDARTVKLLSRAGMGWCQGRECAYATACLTAHRIGGRPDLTSGATRPVATPVPLGLLARADPPTSGQR